MHWSLLQVTHHTHALISATGNPQYPSVYLLSSSWSSNSLGKGKQLVISRVLPTTRPTRNPVTSSELLPSSWQCLITFNATCGEQAGHSLHTDSTIISSRWHKWFCTYPTISNSGYCYQSINLNILNLFNSSFLTATSHDLLASDISMV